MRRRRSVSAASILRSSRGQFGGEEFIVGDRGVQGDRLFAGQQLVGVGDRGSDVVEHEGVEGVGADITFGTAVGFAAGAQGVVVAAAVVAVPGAVAAAHLMAVGADAAGATFDESFEQPLAGYGAARAPLGVVGGDSAGGLEQLVGDDPGAFDRDPFVPVARDHPVAVGRAPIRCGCSRPARCRPRCAATGTVWSDLSLSTLIAKRFNRIRTG
jgi:hypothetical protein